MHYGCVVTTTLHFGTLAMHGRLLDKRGYKLQEDECHSDHMSWTTVRTNAYHVG